MVREEALQRGRRRAQEVWEFRRRIGTRLRVFLRRIGHR